MYRYYIKTFLVKIESPAASGPFKIKVMDGDKIVDEFSGQTFDAAMEDLSKKGYELARQFPPA